MAAREGGRCVLLVLRAAAMRPTRGGSAPQGVSIPINRALVRDGGHAKDYQMNCNVISINGTSQNQTSETSKGGFLALGMAGNKFAVFSLLNKQVQRKRLPIPP